MSSSARSGKVLPWQKPATNSGNRASTIADAIKVNWIEISPNLFKKSNSNLNQLSLTSSKLLFAFFLCSLYSSFYHFSLRPGFYSLTRLIRLMFSALECNVVLTVTNKKMTKDNVEVTEFYYGVIKIIRVVWWLWGYKGKGTFSDFCNKSFYNLLFAVKYSCNIQSRFWGICQPPH